MTERNPRALEPGEPAGRLTRPVDQRTILLREGGGGERGETMMRLPIISLLVIAGAWLGQTQVSDAQSAYSYPWCSLGGTRSSNALSCYYTSWEQCRTTMSGIGGNCVESPYYHAAPTQPLHRSVVKPYRHRHARTVQMSTHERLE